MKSMKSMKRSRQSDDDDEDVPPSQSMRLSQLSERDINNSTSILDSRAGVIEKVNVKNFMCHEAMEINLNANINFVVGRNGSGKSAILMALVVGLGGKASTTKRATALKEFVKKGERTAVIQITLNNTGPLGYKKDVYGDRIIVVRTMSDGPGPNGYKIKSANGRTMSTKREELLRVCAALNIQVDNPVSVLNQDTSRTFLNSSDPGDKYSLFMRATQLDEIDRLHAQAVAAKGDAVNALNVKTQAVKTCKKELDALRKRWEALKSVPDQKRKIEALENELMWAHAIEKERLLAKARDEQEKLEADLHKLKLKTNIEEERETKLQDLIRQNQAQLAALRDESADLEQRFGAARDKFRRSKEAHNNRLREQKAAEAKVKRQQVNVNTLREEIDRIKQETGQTAARRAEIIAQRELLEEQCAAAQDTLRTCAHHYDQLRSNEEPIKEQISSARADINDKTNKINRIAQTLKGMREEKSSNLSVYNPRLPALMAAIDQAHARGLFQKRPVGPMGAHIKLRDASWAPAIEQMVGRGFFSSFRVDNKKDEIQFFKIVDQVLGTRVGAPDVLMGTFLNKVHDVSRNKVTSPGLMSLLDSLIITDPIVANAVIDNQSAESVLLIPTAEQAYPLMEKRENVPANCWRALTKRGDTFYPAPGYKSYSGNAQYTRARFLQVSTQDAIKELQREFESVSRDKATAEKTHRALTVQLVTLETESRKVRGERDKASRVAQKLTLEIAGLQDAEEPEERSVATLSEDLAECEAEMAAAEEEERTTREEVVILKQNMEEARKAASDLSEDAQTSNTREQPILASTEKFRSDLRACLLDKKHCEERATKQEAEVLAAARRTTACATVAAEHVDNAAQLCARIDTRRNKEDIADEKLGLEAKLAEVERSRGSYLEVTEECQVAGERYEVAAAKVKDLDKLVQCVAKALTFRTMVYSKIRSDITIRTILYFKFRLGRRNYTGDLTVDHERMKLSVNVTPAHRGAESADTRTLSGGERSYSTVSFIMALWDSIAVPFYFMDEFDVFMDKVNRRLIMDMLLEFARDNPGKQFVFLTPQDISHVVSEDAVTIHRMEDPRA